MRDKVEFDGPVPSQVLLEKTHAMKVGEELDLELLSQELGGEYTRVRLSNAMSYLMRGSRVPMRTVKPGRRYVRMASGEPVSAQAAPRPMFEQVSTAGDGSPVLLGPDGNLWVAKAVEL
jgi:hypothetical protein